MFTNEDDIERTLKAALDVRPSAAFERRVLEAAAARTQSRRVPWTWLGAAAAVVIAVGAWILSEVPTPVIPDVVVTRVDPPAPTGPATLGEASPKAAGRAARAPAAIRPRRPSPALDAGGAAPDPQVLVPANQLALIRAFAREIDGGRVGLPEDTDTDVRLQTLVVPEMTVQPIAIASLEAGGPGPGSKGLQQ